MDKTNPIADFLVSEESERAFIARPRRFGKTLTLQIMAYMLAAGVPPKPKWQKSTPVDADRLFGGLAVYDRLKGGDASLGTLLREPHFVVVLLLADAVSGIVLMQLIIDSISRAAGRAFGRRVRAEVQSCSSAAEAMSVLVAAVPDGVPVAVLVDGYDSAVLSDISKGDWAAAQRGVEALESLMLSSKDATHGPRIARFVICGATRLAPGHPHSFIFCGANTFVDLTAAPIASRMFGFSEQELRQTFPAELARLGHRGSCTILGMSLPDYDARDVAVALLRQWYG